MLYSPPAVIALYSPSRQPCLLPNTHDCQRTAAIMDFRQLVCTRSVRTSYGTVRHICANHLNNLDTKQAPNLQKIGPCCPSKFDKDALDSIADAMRDCRMRKQNRDVSAYRLNKLYPWDPGTLLCNPWYCDAARTANRSPDCTLYVMRMRVVEAVNVPTHKCQM